MQANADDPETWGDLYRLLPCLRQSLSCYVCTKILTNPIGPTDNVCRHYICENCRGGKMKLKPSCSWCKDHSKFTENILLKILVSSFQKLCHYIYSSTIGQKLSAATVNGETNSLISILQEAINFEDPYIVKTTQSAATILEKMNKTKSEPIQPVPGCSVDTAFNGQSETPAAENDAEDSEMKEIKSEDKLEKQIIHDIKQDTTDTNKMIKPEKKMVVFLKRAAKNRQQKNRLKTPRKTLLFKKPKPKKSRLSRSTKRTNNRGKSDFYPEMSVTLERGLESEQSKKIKIDLPPPELKPPSFCRCGKSGKYNQLTCLGQRCPCYSMKLPCIGCKCKGCRNPKKGPPSSGQDNFSSTILRSGVRNHDSLYVM